MRDTGYKMQDTRLIMNHASCIMHRASCLIHVSKEEDTIRVGEILGGLLEPGSIVALTGQLGA